MADVDEIKKYRELIRQHGSKKAAELIKNSGISYDEDFTEMHKIDPIFSGNIRNILSWPAGKFVKGPTLPHEITLARSAYWVTNFIQIGVNSEITPKQREQIATNAEYAETPITYTL